MTTVIRLNLGEEGGVEKAIGMLDDWVVGKFDPVVDTVVRGIASNVQANMADNAHIVSGRLVGSIRGGLSKVDKNKYQITIDPVDPKSESHYASIEMSRAMEHDFTRNNNTVAAFATETAWFQERSKL